MNILVTGAAGFIGSHVAEAVLERGDTVVGLDNFNDYYDPARKRANAALLKANPRFTLHEADLRDIEAMEHICAEGRFDAIVHLAAMAGVRYSVERAPLYTDVNVRGTVNLLEAVRKAGARKAGAYKEGARKAGAYKEGARKAGAYKEGARKAGAYKEGGPHFVFASTSSVYGRTGRLPFREDDPLGRPLAPYPATKIAAEVMGHAYHNMFGLSFTAVRFFSVYGPRGRPDMMPYIITDCIVHERSFKLYDAGEMYRDWTYVGDIASGIVAAMDRPLGYEVINLGRGEPVRMADFVELVEELVGKRAKMTTPPAPPSEPPITYANIGKARDLLDYDPKTSVAEGMRQMWEWYRAEVIESESV